jgi:hypothetical protein
MPAQLQGLVGRIVLQRDISHCLLRVVFITNGASLGPARFWAL